jgi:hypothetical protein
VPAPAAYEVVAPNGITPLSIVATLDGTAAASFVPALSLYSQDGSLLARIPTDETVAAGGSATVSWFPRVRRKKAVSGFVLDFQVGEIAAAIGTTLDSHIAVTPAFQNITVGDGILVLAAAPSKPSVVDPPIHPFQCGDDFGNTYTQLGAFAFEANPPNVNEGLYAVLFYCQASVGTLEVGSEIIQVDWAGNVFDRAIYIWTVRHAGGASVPVVLAHTADHDAAVFAASQVTLTAPNYTPGRDKSLELAIILTAKAGGVGGFGGVAGWSGFFQAQGRLEIGSKQQYLRNAQTHGEDAYIVAGSGQPQYEDDVGTLPGGVLVPSFNGVAQQYSAGANAWKGIILLGID